MRYLLLALCLMCIPVSAEPLMNLVTVNDGLNTKDENNIVDDYVRLELINPSYSAMNSITKRINEWLGPDMAKAQSSQLLLVQAPRDPSQRVSFLSALMQLEVVVQP